MRKFSFVFCMAVLALSACKEEAFKKGDEGIEYKIISSGKGDVVAYGNFMELQIAQLYNDGKKDSTISDTRTSPQGPAFEMLDSANMPPAYFKILKLLKKGDSLVIKIMVDSAFKNSPQGIPAFFKKGNYLFTTAKLVNIFKTREQADSARNLAMAGAQEKQKVLDAAQIQKDDKTLKDYFAKNNIQAVKAPLGTYVQIITPGTGAAVDTSVVVQTNYTGKTMEGKTFDSNVDPAFNHVQPFLVNMTNDPSLGSPVIPGWTDGMKMLTKGAKAKFYVPSALAYGSQGAGQDIKPNSILIFDIEVVDVLNRTQAATAQATERKLMEAMQKKYMDSMQKANPQPQQPGGPQ
ncbi:MAG: FKBP-type peptidyl-prolyl cis-trans isomerase [Gloeobacteraceae cyanobacterium ES-bin-316]|nr:FKBP-type peptidyl-prolyl cis-trans isomerase [Ferruginibacter sp.]